MVTVECTAEFCRECRCSNPRKVLSHWIVYYDIVNFLLKITDGICYLECQLQLKPWNARGASHHPLVWAAIICTFFSLIRPVDKFSFNEMSMWDHPKISSCCLFV